MAEIPDHLVPTDGLTNSTFALDGLDLVGNGVCDFRFGIKDESGSYVGTFTIRVSPTEFSGSTDAMIAEAYRQMTDILRQWIYVLDQTRQVYETG